MARMSALEGKVEVVKLDDVQFDETYQRESKAHQRYIEANFDRAAVGTPQVARRGTQGLFCIDGRQRIEVMKRLGITQWRCNVVESSGPTYEAHLFRLINDNKGRKSLNTRELFKAAIAASDANALGVKRLAESHGLKLGLWAKQKEHPFVRCVGILYRVYAASDGERVLGKTFELINKMWPQSTEGLHETIIGALAMVVRARQIDEDRFMTMVGKTPPKTIRQNAPAFAGNNRHASVADYMITLYNRRLKVGSPAVLKLFSDKSAPVEQAKERKEDKEVS